MAGVYQAHYLTHADQVILIEQFKIPLWGSQNGN